MKPRRGGFLTAMAILIALAAIEDMFKPFGRQGPTIPSSSMPRIIPGIVVLGIRHTGTRAVILGPLVGVFLILYAIGIWRMRRYALTAAWIYVVYVMLNLTLFMMWNPLPLTRADTIFDAVYSICAIVLTLSPAIALTRRRADLT